MDHPANVTISDVSSSLGLLFYIVSPASTSYRCTTRLSPAWVDNLILMIWTQHSSNCWVPNLLTNTMMRKLSHGNADDDSYFCPNDIDHCSEANPKWRRRKNNSDSHHHQGGGRGAGLCGPCNPMDGRSHSHWGACQPFSQVVSSSSGSGWWWWWWGRRGGTLVQ